MTNITEAFQLALEQTFVAQLLSNLKYDAEQLERKKQLLYAKQYAEDQLMFEAQLLCTLKYDVSQLALDQRNGCTAQQLLCTELLD